MREILRIKLRHLIRMAILDRIMTDPNIVGMIVIIKVGIAAMMVMNSRLDTEVIEMREMAGVGLTTIMCKMSIKK